MSPPLVASYVGAGDNKGITSSLCFYLFFLDEHAENVLAHQFVASMYECFGFKTNLKCYHSVSLLVFDFSKVINEMNPP